MWFVPKLCGVCDTPVTNPAISCSGTCRKAFHPLCVGVEDATRHQATVSSTAGLLWFCSECLPDVRQILELRADEASEESPGAEYKLPPEIWERILQPLSDRQLLHVRRTCRYLRNVVDGSRKTWGRLTAHFPPCTTMDRMYTPTELPAVGKANWHDDFWTKIVNVDHWWPEFGQRLTHIDFGYCEISLAPLLNMLRHTPNLTELTFRNIEHNVGAALPELNFQLNKLKRLRICYSILNDDATASLEALRPILPCLRSFMIETGESEAVLNFVYMLQHSLEELDLCVNDNVLIPVCRLEHLKLKKITLHEEQLMNDEDFIEVCRLQPLLEDIDIDGTRTNEVLCEVARLCSKLKRIRVGIFHIEPHVLVPTFLNSMVELKHLEIILDLEYDDIATNTNFEGIANVHLTDVRFNRMDQIGNNLQMYLQKAPKLTSIHFANCKFHSWSELFTMLENVKLLKELKILRVTVELNDSIGPAHRTLNNLKQLEVGAMPNGALNHLLFLCPNLQELCVKMCKGFALYTELNALKKITLQNNVPHDTLNWQDILNNCRQMQELNVSRESLLADYRELLKNILGSKLNVF